MDREMRSVLAQLELLSHGKAMNWSPTSGGESDEARPFGEAHPLHEEFRSRWLGAPAHKRPDVLQAAREALDTWKGVGRSQQAQEWDEEAWILKDGEGFEAIVVARRFNTSAERVRKLRLRANRCGEFGLPYVEPQEIDRTERVLFLLGKQMSVRAVAQQLGLHSTQVQRIKQRAA